MQVLNGFAQRYGVQSPEDAVKHPRAEESWGNASVLSNISMLGHMNSFWRDFGVGTEPNTVDQQERNELGRTILRVFDRYGVAQVEYENQQGERIPLKVNDWDREKSIKGLVEVISE